MKYQLPAVTRLLIYAMGAIQKGWTQNTNARDADGMSVRADSEDAVAFCLSGAISRAVSDLGIRDGSDYEARQVARTITGGFLVDYNDNPARTKEEVLAVLKQAAFASAEEAA